MWVSETFHPLLKSQKKNAICNDELLLFLFVFVWLCLLLIACLLFFFSSFFLRLISCKVFVWVSEQLFIIHPLVPLKGHKCGLYGFLAWQDYNHLLRTIIRRIYNVLNYKQLNHNYTYSGFSLRILVAGERCNVTGEYFERGSTSEYI